MASGRKLGMDRAVAKNDVNSYVKLAQQEYDGLEKLKGQYDPDTEQDKIDDLTLKQENLRDKVNGYIEKGYIKKSASGKGVSQLVSVLKYTMAAIKPPTPPKAPTFTVKSTNLPANYRQAPLRQYSVSKPTVSATRKRA